MGIEVSLDPLRLWNRFAVNIGLEEYITRDIEIEFNSSVEWQGETAAPNDTSSLICDAEHSYKHPPSSPSFPSLSVIWEQSIVQGHPTHPVRFSPASVILG